MKHKPILFRRFVLAVGVAAMVSACGQRGALYLPNDVPPEQRSPFPQVLIPGMGKPATPTPAAATPSAETATPKTP
jgi:predicted small lipoprotein YifL